MHRKIALFCLVLVLSLCFGSASLAKKYPPTGSAPDFRADLSSSTVNYGAGYRANAFYFNLTIHANYTLLVANNTYSAYNISWEAYDVNASVYYNYYGMKTDIFNNSLSSIEIELIDNDTQSLLTDNFIPLVYSSNLETLLSSSVSIMINITDLLGVVTVVAAIVALAKHFYEEL